MAINGLDFEKSIVEMERKIEELRRMAADESYDFAEEIAALERKLLEEKKRIYSSLTPWQRTQLARHPDRPYPQDYVRMLFEEFTELCGDRAFGDDRAVLGGLGRFRGRGVVVIGTRKGRDTKENLAYNFGMAHPEGYRKARRLMRLADKFSLPIISLIDTPGAYPGVGAEERGQGMAIAENLLAMARLSVPMIAVIVGEGASGGALAIGMGNRVLMMEHAWYGVCSPEACSAILWRDQAKAPEAASTMRITAKDLLELGVIDEVVPEPLGGAHNDPAAAAEALGDALARHLDELSGLSPEQLRDDRYARFRRMGVFAEGEVASLGGGPS